MLHYNDSSKRIDVKKNNEESGDNWQRRNAPRTHVMSPCRCLPQLPHHFNSFEIYYQLHIVKNSSKFIPTITCSYACYAARIRFTPLKICLSNKTVKFYTDS
jgi:hypothetical protein